MRKKFLQFLLGITDWLTGKLVKFRALVLGDKSFLTDEPPMTMMWIAIKQYDRQLETWHLIAADEQQAREGANHLHGTLLQLHCLERLRIACLTTAHSQRFISPS